MSIPSVTEAQVTDILRALGVRHGYGLLVHSALQFLGRPQDGPATYLDALWAVLGAEGTVAVPAFNFAFARGEDYDPVSTASEGMGIFSEFVRQQPEALRSPHPMQSFAVLGKHSAEIAGRDTPSAFDKGSAFARMLQLDFKLLLLGAEIQAASCVHYSEQRAQVPYRYWKEFRGRIRSADGWQTRTYRMFVRDLELDPRLRLKPIQEALEASGQWASQALNFGQVSLCRLVDFVAATDELLRKDPWVLVPQAVTSE